MARKESARARHKRAKRSDRTNIRNLLVGKGRNANAGL